MKLRKIKNSLTLQYDQTDCGPACLKTILNYYDGHSSLERIREICGTNKEGTTLLGLYQGANQLGFEAAGYEGTIEELKKQSSPIILHIRLQELDHYVVCFGYEKGQFIIADPGYGLRKYSTDELDFLWQSKLCLTLEKSESFKKEKSIKNKKIKWLSAILKKDKDIIFMSLLIGILVAALDMTMAVFSQKLIDDYLPEKDFQKIIISILFVIFILTFKSGFTALRQKLLITQSKNFNLRIIDSFFHSLLYLPKSFFDTRRVGELVARLNDTARIQSVISQIIGGYIINTLVLLTSIVFLLFYSKTTALIVSLSAPIYFFVLHRFNKTIISSQKNVMASYAQVESNFVNTMSGINEVKSLNKQEHFATINNSIYNGYQDNTFKLGSINIRLGLIAGIIGTIYLGVVLMYNSILVYKGGMQVGELMAVLGISSTVLPALATLASISIPLHEASIAYNRMFEFMELPHEDGPTAEESFLEIKSIQVLDLCFRFPGKKRVLNQINIALEKGSLTTIIGESGCGKSTLCSLLQKNYAPENGKITINNSINIKDINTSVWRDKLGIIPQEITIFGGDVIYNICFSNEKAEQAHVYELMKKYGLNKFFEQLPNGYSTYLGEEGINLSGGQKQLIAFARALYKKPQLLILDEATSAMDRDTENFCIDLINILKPQMSILFVSHRLHVLKNITDNIYIIENQTIKHQGNHQQLMKTENIYSEYWNAIL